MPFTSRSGVAPISRRSVGHIRRAHHRCGRDVSARQQLQPIGARMMALACLCTPVAMKKLCGMRTSAVQMGQSRTVAPLPDIYSLLAIRAGAVLRGGSVHRRRACRRKYRCWAALRLPRSCVARWKIRRSVRQRSRHSTSWSRICLPHELDQPLRKRLILWHAMLGDLDGAFAFLTRTLDHYAQFGTVGSAWGVLWLPEMKPLRADPRFQAFAARIGWVDYWREYGPPDVDCSPLAIRAPSIARRRESLRQADRALRAAFRR